MAEYDIPALARDLLAKHNSVKFAIDALEAMAHADRELFVALMSNGLRAVCDTVIRNAVAASKDAAWSGRPRGVGASQTSRETGVKPLNPLVGLAGRDAAFEAEGKSNMRASLMDFRLGTGKRLADATIEEVDTQAEFYEGRARDMTVKGRWLRLISRRMYAGVAVAEVLSEDDLANLQIEAASVSNGLDLI